MKKSGRKQLSSLWESNQPPPDWQARALTTALYRIIVSRTASRHGPLTPQQLTTRDDTFLDALIDSATPPGRAMLILF